MIPSQYKPADSCPKCGAVRKPGRSKCWLCSAALPPPGTGSAAFGDVAAIWEPPRLEPPAGPFQYGLSSLFLIITLGAILCSIAVMEPGLGIAAAILATPALIWTIVAAARRGNRGQPMSAEKKINTFVLALLAFAGGAVVVIGAFVMAMIGSCMAINGDRIDGGNETIPIVIGGLVAVAVAGVLVRVVWKHLHRKNRW
jgi:hypothetical protein